MLFVRPRYAAEWWLIVMKIERITDNTVRITLNKRDLETRNIDAEKLKINSPAYQQLLWDIIEHAEIEFGFDVSEGQIVIETTSGVTGEYIVTITRTGGLSDSDYAQSGGQEISGDLNKLMAERILESLRTGSAPEPGAGQSLKGAKERLSGEVDEVPELMLQDEKYDVLYFSDFENLILLLHSNPRFKAVPAQLYSYQKGYYLVLKVAKRNLSIINQLEHAAPEFGGIYVVSEIFRPILEEHGNLLLKRGAIAKLTKYFNE